MKINGFDVDCQIDVTPEGTITGWFELPSAPHTRFTFGLDLEGVVSIPQMDVAEIDLDAPPIELAVAGLDNVEEAVLLGRGTTLNLIDEHGRAFSVTWEQIQAFSEAFADAAEEAKEQVQMPDDTVADVKPTEHELGSQAHQDSVLAPDPPGTADSDDAA